MLNIFNFISEKTKKAQRKQLRSYLQFWYKNPSVITDYLYSNFETFASENRSEQMLTNPFVFDGIYHGKLNRWLYTGGLHNAVLMSVEDANESINTYGDSCTTINMSDKPFYNPAIYIEKSDNKSDTIVPLQDSCHKFSLLTINPSEFHKVIPFHEAVSSDKITVISSTQILSNYLSVSKQLNLIHDATEFTSDLNKYIINLSKLLADRKLPHFDSAKISDDIYDILKLKRYQTRYHILSYSSGFAAEPESESNILVSDKKSENKYQLYRSDNQSERTFKLDNNLIEKQFNYFAESYLSDNNSALNERKLSMSENNSEKFIRMYKSAEIKPVVNLLQQPKFAELKSDFYVSRDADFLLLNQNVLMNLVFSDINTVKYIKKTNDIADCFSDILNELELSDIKSALEFANKQSVKHADKLFYTQLDVLIKKKLGI